MNIKFKVVAKVAGAVYEDYGVASLEVTSGQAVDVCVVVATNDGKYAVEPIFETQYLAPEKKKIARGDRFRSLASGGTYILASAGAKNGLVLVNLDTGNAVSTPVPVAHYVNVSDSEWHHICGGCPHEFVHQVTDYTGILA